MKKPVKKRVTVVSTQTITPNMQRIVLEGDELAQFPINCEGSYIKLLFNQEGGTDISALNREERPVMRTYTIRRFSPQRKQIEVDFVRHTTNDLSCGFAARWAVSAQVGDPISIVGPGSIQDMNIEADWFLMAADMTALPALSAKIEQLPENAKGYAVIKVASQEDRQPLNSPKGIEVKWIVGNEDLAEQVKALPWLTGDVSVWSACEFDSMRALRQYFRNEKQVERQNIYISSYWKQGVTEDGHKVIKQQDAKEQMD
ncbi:siderophore-interacting protein [Vibrio japonicus]|uniref:Siderophore-interacting protein n=1 Tax=Vibrio japonicus TaxID=1824638 RepID=A0ABY5LNQ5_9VIBR|nr:siderophore-interacting protein [Vibrio japonicus]UUM32344.1 siderophore-interacting protein [Vibrio japonicus]